MMFKDKKFVLGVCGGIAAYKSAELCSWLRKEGAQVRVVMTQHATEFIAPLTFETLTQSPVYLDLFAPPRAYEMEHISWACWGDAFVIAPATANTIAKMAAGIADDALTTLYLSFEGPVVVAPAMNTRMWQHPATRANIATLEVRGVHIISPETGPLACGEEGEGRLASVRTIVDNLAYLLSQTVTKARTPRAHPETDDTTSFQLADSDGPLSGKTVVITSGPTHEYIDPVRFLTNPSSGKMGCALARAAAQLGATVHLVTGPVNPTVLPEECATIHKVTTAEQMLLAVEALRDKADVFIFAAAVSDFRVDRRIEQKIKRTGNSLTLELVENPDIAQAIGAKKRPDQVSVGFAAETHDVEANALCKMSRKRLDAIVANDVANPRIGFESDDNEVTIYVQNGDKRFISRRPKEDVARAVMEVVVELLQQKQRNKQV
ncbi:MAG: bifunctional phosphopantothenoylcysteine decarboxylase/phosphopantothenate synthase [Candidatus Sumerlaeaceae bacterium]|nr:bifunctional phosphopantothenoylcysteine decarboxylase/phosphopantothenate synthase [Candidatus Sumerlaeaceae bacterium]